MQRRNFLAVLGGLPFLGWLKPEPKPITSMAQELDRDYTVAEVFYVRWTGESATQEWWSHHGTPWPMVDGEPLDSVVNQVAFADFCIRKGIAIRGNSKIAIFPYLDRTFTWEKMPLCEATKQELRKWQESRGLFA